MKTNTPAVIDQRIYLVRGHKVMFDVDLALLYGVSTKALNQAVKRNLGRFPEDFMFRLNTDEAAAMRSQSVTASRRNIGRPPYAFTEHGALMLASVLNSPVATQASIQVVRAFVRLRRILSENQDLARKLEELEGKYDRRFKIVFKAIRELMTPPDSTARKKIGFEP